MYSKKVENYLEAIYNITQRKGHARVKDIARELGVKPPSVSEAMVKLKQAGLVNYEKYGSVTLTNQGEKIGKTVKHRHDTIKSFLKKIMVPERIADLDACKLEHELSPESMEQLIKFVKFMESYQASHQWLTVYEQFCKEK